MAYIVVWKDRQTDGLKEWTLAEKKGKGMIDDQSIFDTKEEAKAVLEENKKWDLKNDLNFLEYKIFEIKEVK
ncbi:MAG: hypothetical protein HRT99_04155 [Mycoplasmatales bacterium]|nr:hypothetical protein [Mycoplasmatales bacterium]